MYQHLMSRETAMQIMQDMAKKANVRTLDEIRDELIENQRVAAIRGNTYDAGFFTEILWYLSAMQVALIELDSI